MKVELKPQAIKDLRSLQKQEAERIAVKLAELENGLTGNIKPGFGDSLLNRDRIRGQRE